MDEQRVFKVTTELQPSNQWASEAINEQGKTELIVLRSTADQSLFDLFRHMIKYYPNFKMITPTDELTFKRTGWVKQD